MLTTTTRWQAELMQQLLASGDIPTKIIDLGVKSYLGAGTPAARAGTFTRLVDCIAAFKSPRRRARDLNLFTYFR